LKQQYRISTWRFDERKSTYSTPTFEGETVEACDKQALEHFRQVSSKPENSWEGMDIVRIDSPAVAEKTTFLEENGRQSGD
jgi:hypothetical protein